MATVELKRRASDLPFPATRRLPQQDRNALAAPMWVGSMAIWAYNALALVHQITN